MAMVSMFVILCIVLCAVVVNGGALYYRVGGGQVFGPFEEEQVVAWYRDGYLQTGEVLVSDRPDGSFSPIEQNIVPQNAIVSTPRKRRSLISKLSKKAGSVLSIQRRNLASISKSLAPNFPQYDGVLKREASELTLGGDNIEGMHRAESEDQFLPDSVATSVSDISSERDLTPSSVDDQPCESDEAPTTPMTDEDEQEMLAQLKRDVPSSSESGPLALSSEHGRVHPEESAPQKYSVKSLAKADYSLWDAEDVGAKKSASVDAFLRELETISTQPDTSELSSPPHAAVTMGALNRKRLLKQLNAIVMEILRYLGGIVMKLLPGPLQHCALIVGTLLSAKENHPALVSLLLLNAVSMLRDLLYIALVPAVYALVCSLPGLVTIAAAQSASVIDSKAFRSATAGGIVTAVLDHTTAAGASAAPVSVRRVQAAPGVSASLREVLRFVRSLDRHTAQQAAQAGWQKLQSMRLPGADDVYLVYQQALLRVHGTVLQVASIDKETLTVVLVLASLLLLQSVVLPRLEAHLANTVVVLPNDQQQDCDLEYSADDLATERSTSKPGWVADCESLLQNKVAASPMVRYIRVVSRIVLRLTVCSVLVATVRASLKSVDDRTRSLLLLPLYASVALSAAEFYRQPRPNTHSESRTETMASAPTSSTDRLSYLCDVVSSKRLWAECSRWGLNAYILALLANEQGRVRAHSTSLFDVSGDETAAATTRQRMPLSSVLFRVKVLILSVYVWLQVHASGVFSNGQLDLVRDVYETLRAPHTAGVATWIASMLLLRPVESFQQAAVLLLGRVGKQGKAGADFVVRSTSSLSQQATAARVTSTLCVVLIVLVLPGLLQFGQSALLSEIRPTSPTLTHPPSSTSDVRANVARALLRSHLALTGASSGASGALQGAHGHGHGWSTPGPDPARGIVLEDVTATVGGKAVLRVRTYLFYLFRCVF